MLNNPKDRDPKRERRWQTSQERARVAAELIEEAESLTQTGAIATPDDVARAELPPPIRIAQPLATPAPTSMLDPEERQPEEPTAPPAPAPAPPPASTTSAEPSASAPPDDPLYLAARDASERGDIDKAASSYRDLLARDPRHVKARNNLALILDARGDRDGALAELDRALDIIDDCLAEIEVA